MSPMTRSRSIDMLGTLDVELLRHVLIFATPHDVLTMRTVAKYAREAIDVPHFLEAMLKEYYPKHHTLLPRGHLPDWLTLLVKTTRDMTTVVWTMNDLMAADGDEERLLLAVERSSDAGLAAMHGVLTTMGVVARSARQRRRWLDRQKTLDAMLRHLWELKEEEGERIGAIFARNMYMADIDRHLQGASRDTAVEWATYYTFKSINWECCQVERFFNTVPPAGRAMATYLIRYLAIDPSMCGFDAWTLHGKCLRACIRLLKRGAYLDKEYDWSVLETQVSAECLETVVRPNIRKCEGIPSFVEAVKGYVAM